MRSKWTVLAAAAAMLWVAPQVAVAGDDVEAQIRAMNDRMAQMEQQLQATQEELEASKQRVEQQQVVIQDLDEDRQAASGLSKFLSETEFSGLVAASYTYNFKNFNSSAVAANGSSTTNGENGSLSGLVAPHHSNSNNFQIDQLAFRMKKTPTPESRAGWGASLVWGASADHMAGRSDDDATGDLPHLHEAYASYMADIGSGVTLTGGRFSTTVGAESYFVNENFNITRGLLWSLQPVNFTGANVGGDCECGIYWQIGASNSYGNTMADTDTEPTFIGMVGYKADTVGFKLNGVYGGSIDDLVGGLSTFGLVGVGASTGQLNTPPYTSPAFGYQSGVGRNSDKIGLLDAVLTWDPSDSLSTWVNFDYYWTGFTQNSGQTGLSNLNIWGIAGAGRYALTEATGFSLRYEYLSFDEFGRGTSSTDADLMSLTATLDHHLTDNLVLTAEGRWDRGRIDEGSSRIYLEDPSGSSLDLASFRNPGNEANNHQVLGLVQLRYDF